MSHAVADVVSLVGLDGVPLRSLSADATWLLEDREDSTNRLTVTVPLADAADVVEDMELMFRARRFKIVEVNRGRVSAKAEIVADESQVEFADVSLSSFKLDGAFLSDALETIAGHTLWHSGGVFDDSGSYYANFEDQPASALLRFLQAQSGQRLAFDSLNRIVSLVASAEEESPDRVFTYGVGVSNMEKNSTAPEATVIEPTGKSGMTIENVNGGKKVVEDFSWYTGLGLSLAVARARFTKKQFWHDDRYVYAANLMRDAKAKLAVLSRPKINYKITATPTGLALGDRVWVVDEELGVKLATRVSLVKSSNDASQDTVELDYLPQSFASTVSESAGDSSSTAADQVIFQVKNENVIALGAAAVPVLRASVLVFADTAFQVGVAVRAVITTAGAVSGYFMLNGVRLDAEIAAVAPVGPISFGLPFLVPGVHPGMVNLDLYMSAAGGSVPVRAAEMFVVTRGAFGGITNDRPDRAVDDQIGEWTQMIVGPSDQWSVVFPTRIPEVFAEPMAEWFAGFTVPADAVALAYKPHFTVAGDVLSLSGMRPLQEFTVKVEDGTLGLSTFTADAAGAGTVDLGTFFTLAPGTYNGTLLEFNQVFVFTV